MATLADINAALATLAANIAAEKQQVADAVAALQAQIQALQDQITNGGVVSAADLDAVVAAVNDLNTAVQNIQEPGAA